MPFAPQFLLSPPGSHFSHRAADGAAAENPDSRGPRRIMHEYDHHSRTANVVATFETQDEADEALLELRLAGFRDRRIGYFARTPTGELTDLLERNFWITGATIGAIVGALLGVWLAWVIPNLESPYARRLDTFGLMVTCATFGSLFLSCAGGMIGAGISRRWLPAPEELGPEAAPFVIAVNAGADRDLAIAALQHRGGYNIRSIGPGEPGHSAPYAVAHPA